MESQEKGIKILNMRVKRQRMTVKLSAQRPKTTPEVRRKAEHAMEVKREKGRQGSRERARWFSEKHI